MTLKELLTRIALDGAKSVMERETGACLEGGLQGFALVNTVETLEELEQMLDRERGICNELMRMRVGKEISVDEYKKQRYVVLQLEYAYEIVKVAYKDTGRFPTLSSRAVLKYAEIVGVKEQDANVP